MRFYKNLSIPQKQIVWAWAFLALPVLFYVVIRFYPTANAFVLSFQEWNLLGDRKFVGLENYAKLFSDPVFWKVFKNTFMYLILGTPISLVLSFIIAYHLDKVRFMHGTIRALYFLPFMTSAVAMAWVWRWFYQPVPIGVFNNFLASLGFAQIEFLSSTTNALPSVLAPAVWAGLGFQVIIFMAGLRAIPQSYYEAARIDGVSTWTVLTEITIPLLKPTIVFLVVFSSIGFLRIFDQVFNMTTNNPGGPLNSTKPLVLLIYDTAFNGFNMGYAAAQTVVLFTILLVVSLIQLRLLKDS
ncbi:sugar ABC transporter permease [Nitratireductor aquimarinus]|uniref:Sugar ABC transporter permease n=1 Tax=Nitratireductor aquimarinus TaxID=889300 RepID=A0ABU4AKA9_9HYPH|nr:MULTISPECIES: sugar ABC transporter permease [Alphaproteobacteria]MBY6021297.1 sugar ABC transporter permease [Nitratireductor sp. DP7N14-4]MBN7756511.1 sugar ABC transporter permease [Nitratireductor aquimarinus]MBN7760117.1 sugar ABC transporter permease [Nitratireductor aquibiodomus]MBN7776921.1 sugar ABC transporter permease [Nitratireductor pacificus]MBN7780255.1 sugar ABC transporter permease [Nitratireductor pacificus]